MQDMGKVMNKKDSIWLGKYFLDDNCDEENFIDEFKKFVNNKDSNEKIIFEKLYASSRSVVFYPKLNNNEYDNKKNILLVTHELSRTGAPIVVLDTAKVLIKNGYFVTVISLIDGPLLEDFLNIGVPVVIMKEMKEIQYFRIDTYQLYKKMDLDIFVKNFDLTIMVTATLFNFVKRYFNCDKKIFWWIHEGSASYSVLNTYMPKRITPNIQVLCGGEYAVLQLAINGFLYYPKVLNYGVFDERKKYKHQNNKTKVKFLLAGSMGPRKGQLILLEAIKNLDKKYRKDAEFIFVGDYFKGDIAGQNTMKELIEYSKDNDDVKVYRSIPREKLYELYQTIDVLVLASLDDPMPVVATENFMLENICLCSTMIGTSYYIEDGISGFIFETGDHLALMEKLEYIIKNKNELKEIKKKGRKIYDDYFEITIFEKNLLKLVEGE